MQTFHNALARKTHNLEIALLAPIGALVLMMVYYIYIRPLFQIFTQSLDAIDVTSVTLRGGIKKNKLSFSSEKLRRGGGGVPPNPKFPYQKKLGLPNC